MKLPDKIYNALKWVCLIVLPACSTLYWSLANIWHWPFAEEVTGTIAAVGTFLGVIIGISSRTYYEDAREDYPEQAPDVYEGGGDDGDI